jgi:long-chain acyl-CoA synthetase
VIFDRLTRMAVRAPLTSGLRTEGQFQPYAQLVERIAHLAAGFASRGLEQGDPVAILLPNSPQMFVVVHALFAIGAIAMPLSLTATRAECALAARKAKVKAVVAEAELNELAQQIAEDVGGATVILSGAGGEKSLAALELTQPITLPKLPPETPALYLLSSGSTGLPKVVPHTHAELIADGERTSSAWSLTPDDIVFDMLPGNFAMGLLMGVMDAAEVGATTVYWHDTRPLILARRALLDAIVAERITFMGTVPAAYEILAGVPGDTRLPSMRLAFSGGAALKEKTYLQFRDRYDIKLRQDYGSTEAIFVSHNDSDDVDATWDSVGRPAGDAMVRISPIKTGLGPDVGELMIQSSSMTPGYLDDPQSNTASFIDGWLMTGDLARIGDDGGIRIKGRSKLLIEVSGFKIDPVEVEEALQLHPAVAEAVVVGVRPNEHADQRLKAFVVRKGDTSPDHLIRFMRERLSAQKVPTLIEFRDALPKSSAGKVMRAQLVEETR